MLDRQDWLVLFLGLPEGRYHTDQIRVMKALFLLSQEGPSDVSDLYDFEAYDYGPFDVGIYGDLESLERDGLVRIDPVAGTRRRVYRLTGRGKDRANELMAAAPTASVDAVRQTKQLVTDQDFTSLLKYVYAKYPDFAVNTKARL